MSEKDEKEARSIFGQYGVDYEDRVNFDRLRSQRLQRLQTKMQKEGFSATILFDPINIRYATGARFGGTGLIARKFLRYAIVPAHGDPLLYEYYFAVSAAKKLLKNVESARGWWYFYAGENAGSLARAWAKSVREDLKRLGADGGRVGLDKVDVHGYNGLAGEGVAFEDAEGLLERTRSIKTPDELELIKLSCTIADVAIEHLREKLRPGVRENELFATLAYWNMVYGGSHMELTHGLLASGTRTNPWFQEATDKIVRTGELVAFDTDMAGPMGYLADVCRTYLCGDARPTPEQREAYNLAYGFVQELKKVVRPGVTFREIAERAPEVPREYRANRYVAIVHGAGLEDEYPIVHFPDIRENYDGAIEENMVICLEAYYGREGGLEGVKLEEQGVVTSTGYHPYTTAPYEPKLLD